MKKIEKSIKDAKKALDKYSKGKQFASNDIKSFIVSLDTKTKELSSELKAIEALKRSLKEKKKKIEGKRSEIKDYIDGLTKLARTESKELLKRQKAEKDLLKAKELKETQEVKKETKAPATKRVRPSRAKKATTPT